jgi:hypothetical protein
LYILGLVAFSGIKHLEFDKDSKSTSSKLTPPINNTEDSDSDSDYEYFKVQKELKAKEPQTVETESDEDMKSEPSKLENTFHEAVKTAIVEDELILPASVNQTFLVVPMKLRLVTLCSLIVEHCVLNKRGGKMIVFMATLEMVDYHSELIETVLTGKNVKVKKKGQGKKSNVKNKKSGEDSDDDQVSEIIIF